MTTAKNVEFTPNGSTYTTLLDLVYPVGSVYLTRRIDNYGDNAEYYASPASVFGGTWTFLQDVGCLRAHNSNSTNSEYANGTYRIGDNTSLGSDMHVHNVAGPSKDETVKDNKGYVTKDETLGHTFGVRTSISFGGYATDDNSLGILWARYNPSYCGTVSSHPGFNNTYTETNGFSMSFTKPEAFKFNASSWVDITDTKGAVNNVAGCYGWTRPQTSCPIDGKQESFGKTWDDSGNYYGDRTPPVKYIKVCVWERIG